MPPVPAPTSTPLENAVPFLWLGGFLICLALHVGFHPLAPVYRQAIRWLGRHPAPILWLGISVFLTRLWEHHFQKAHAVATAAAASAPLDATEWGARALAPWHHLLLEGLGEGLRHFALIFHQVIDVPNFWPDHWAGAALQAAVLAFTQIWMSCYLINSRNIFVEEGLSLKQALVRWPHVLVLAACYFPWWWIQGPGSGMAEAKWAIARQWILPEYFIFLAPLPLAMATLRGNFVKAGEWALSTWKIRGGLLLAFSLTALPLLTLLHYCLSVLPDALLSQWPIACFAMEGVLIATVHLWLFVSAALLLLWGGYVEDAQATPLDLD